LTPFLGVTPRQRSLVAPDEQRAVGDDHGLVMDLSGVLIEGAGGLGAKVTVLEVEVERADAVRAADAGELHASLDPLGGVVSHGLIVVSGGEGAESTVVGWRR
jgi:hypothetical protein